MVFNPLPEGTRFKYCDQILREEKKGKKRKRKEYSILLGFSFERKLRAQILILVAVRDFFYGRR